MNRFPVLISIPHGGTSIPVELIERISIEERDIFDDMDPFTREIYGADSWAMEVMASDIARAFLDLNRAPDDLPPNNPDGVIKSVTCYQKTIYKKGMEPDKSLIQTLIEQYYHPYHWRLHQRALQNKELELALDCHTMAAEPPPIAPDTPGQKRPLICLGNNHHRASDNAAVQKLAACFRKAFELEDSDVTINRPFAGGYITRHHGNNPLPWIQVEMNRSLYLDAPWFDSSTLRVDGGRLRELNGRFRVGVELFFG